MKNAQEALKNTKLYKDNIEVPQGIEDRVRQELSSNNVKRKRDYPLAPWYLKHKGLIAAAVIIVCILSFNFDNLWNVPEEPYQHISGPEEILEELEQLGTAQRIDKSLVYENGVALFLDSMINTDDHIILIYRTTGEDDNKRTLNPELLGVTERYISYGHKGYKDTQMNQIIWVARFIKPQRIENELTFRLTSVTMGEGFKSTQPIEFDIDIP